MKKLFLKVSLIVTFFTLNSFAATPALQKRFSVQLSDFKGSPYLVAMLSQSKGIKANIDRDYAQVYTVADWNTVRQALYGFDAKIVRKVIGSFPNGIQGFETLVTSLSGRQFRPVEAYSLAADKLTAGADTYAVSQVIAMGSGAGSLVVLDQNNYFYNFGYKSGNNPNEDVKSGRSFAAGPIHNANDVSDLYYLNELERYMQETSDLRPFCEALLKILLQSDTSGISQLSPRGQTVLTDFIAVYTAESDRHIMVHLDPHQHPWENDLTEATFVSVFGTTVGKVMQNGILTPGKPKQWWAMSPLNNGRSGIGETRGDRRKLQRHISKYAALKNPALVQYIEGVVGHRFDGDLFRALMEFMNTEHNQERVQEQSSSLIAAYVELLALSRADATLIETQILSQQLKP